MIQIALINSPPRWTTRGYDFAYGNMVDFSTGEPGVMVPVQNAGQQGERAGELGAAIGGFLTRIHSMKIDGERVYEDQRTFDNQEEAPQAVNG